MKKILYITTTFSLLFGTASAQQLPLSSLYNVNKFQVNSAYAGFNNCLEGYLSHRSQWIGLEGSPTTQYLSLHSGISKNMGLGANLVYDKTDIINKFSGSLSYAYRVKLGQEHNLRLGISAGMYQISTNTLGAIVTDESDDVVIAGNQTNMAFSNEFGMFYNFKKLELGLSIPQIFETNANFDLENTNGGFGLKRHYIWYAGYEVPLSEKISLQPSLLYKSQNFNQGQLDVNGQLTYNELLFIGVGYRLNAGFLARFGLNIKDLFTVAYAYEFASGDVGVVSTGSHEIMLGLKLCKDKKDKITKVEPVKPEPKAEQVIVPEIIPEPVIEEVEIEQPVEQTKVEEELPVAKEIPTIEGVIKEEEVKTTVEEEEIETVKTSLTSKEKHDLDLKIAFPLNQKNFDNSVNKSLDKVTALMLSHPNIKLKVTGHSCDLGSAPTKSKISIKRAQMVKSYLVSKGINTSRIKAVGASDTKSLVPNTSIENRRRNRRVEFEILE